jgi:hypothetical protein
MELNYRLHEYTSLKELASALTRDGFDPVMSEDFWETPFVYSCEKIGEVVEIRIVSCGKNKVFENGLGDDLALKITKKKQQATLELRWILADGTPKVSVDQYDLKWGGGGLAKKGDTEKGKP